MDRHHKYLEFLRRLKQASLPLFGLSLSGSGGAYVIAIIAAIMLGSYLITGGLLPNIERSPQNPQYVQIEDTSKIVNKDTLQLINIQAVPSPTPNLSPTPPACSEGVVAGILVDVSGSMAGVDSDQNPRLSKLDNLKIALNQFIDLLPKDDIVVNLQPFATDSFEFVPFDYLSNNTDLMHQAISSLETAGADRHVEWQGQSYEIGSSTYQKNAVEKITPRLLNAKSKFPNGQTYLIFMTDGVPETNDCRIVRADGQYHIADDVNSPLCGVTFDTHPQNPVAASQVLKDQGVKIFTIALYGQREVENSLIQEGIKKVMRDTASDPDSTYYLESPTSDQLRQAYQTIIQRICR